MLLNEPMSRESKSGKAAAISSALISGFSLTTSLLVKANGAGSNLGRSTSILNFRDSSVG